LSHSTLSMVIVASFLGALPARADSYAIHTFDRVALTDVYYSEGINVGDIDQDGAIDVVHGPYWFAGPDFRTAHEIYPAKAQPREAYADSFFSWVYDFNGDSWPDVLAVGFPGTPAYVYENPGRDGLRDRWTKHEVFDWVSNESPQFTQLVGGPQPELVCTRDGKFGYVTWDAEQPFATWTFHAASDAVAPKRFGHGLGVGDVDGDGRADVLMKDGWFQQPESLEGDPMWPFHAARFAPAGGAEMYVYDVDGDGDSDVITSLAAHAFGLAWHEQRRDDEGRIAFREHRIMGDAPEENRYGVVFSELHSVNLADMDGDGLKDIVTGKTYWSHHTQAPMWDAGAVVYWFKLVRGDDGVDWIPKRADGEAGIGRQVIVADVNDDQSPDIVTGGMKGAHVLLHRREAVDEARWRAAQPRPWGELADGLPPDEAARQMTVPEGFSVQLAAGEPQVHQPIGFAIDPRGRLWVAEAYTYPIRAPEGEGRDKIVILEDTDGDGTLDSRKVFCEGLNLVSGLEVGFGGVWVGAAPYLLFIPDADGDDAPDDEPQVLLDGFGYQDTHETLNAFIWGPDGWLYGCHGVFTHSRVGKPGTPDEQRTPLNAGVWRYHPTEHKFEVFAWGTSNPWGVDFNDHGQAFITACVIPHLFHVIQGARYQRQGGRHFSRYVYDDIKTIADHAHYVGNIRDHAWWGHEPHIPSDTSQAGGGHAHCGAMIYLGDNWPAEHRNQIFFNNIHGNRVNNDLLERSGSGYVGRHGPDLLLANDRWFRGINLKYGPDGSVYLIDWYDRNACHRTNPEIWDRSNGRIYRIRYDGTSEPATEAGAVATSGATAHGTDPPRDLTKLTDRDLVALHSHANEWYVRTARRILQERGGSEAVHVELAARLDGAPDVPTKLRALWTLHATDGLDDALALELLESPHEYLRAWSIQLQLEDVAASDEFLKRLGELARDDESPVVRLYLAAALQRLRLEDRWMIATALVTHGEDAGDRNLPLMIWYGLEPLVAADTPRALELARTSQIPLIRQFILRRAATDNRLLNDVVRLLDEPGDAAAEKSILDAMLGAFEGRVDIPMPPAWEPAYAKLSQSGDESVRALADRVAVLLGDKRIFPRMRALLADNEAALEKRREALEILVRGRDIEAAAPLRAALHSPALRGPAIRALAAYDDPQTATAILAVYKELNAEERADAIGTLVARPGFAHALLDAIEQANVARTDVHAYHVRQLARFDDARLVERLEQVWGRIRETSADKLAAITQYKSQLTPAAIQAADLGNGRRIFAKTCSSCHKLFGDGGTVGPDITGSNRANLDYILENVVDPSAVLGKDYRMTILVTVDGRVLSGLVLNETDSAVTLRTINDTLVVPLSDIVERQLADQSLMPERLLDSLTPDETRDLIAYLGSPVQVSLRGPDAPIDAETGRVDGAIEGESLKVVAKSAGTARSQNMKSFAKDRWSGADHLWWTGAKPDDRLELEVPVAAAGSYEIELVLTRARDYGIVRLAWDGEPLGGPIDLFNSPDVVTTGVLTFGPHDLTAGNHRLEVTLVGANPEAAKAYMFGLDYVRLKAADAAR